MMLGLRPKKIMWTRHARAKMRFYKLSEQRVLRVIHTPKRTEEGVAPKTIAMMQPASIKISGGRARLTISSSEKKKEVWSQEIWAMVQDGPTGRKIISAWRYPGVTKPRSEIAAQLMKKEYNEFLSQR